MLGLISSLVSNRRFCVVLDWKSLKEYPVNAGVPEGLIIDPTIFLLYINDLYIALHFAIRLALYFEF